MPPAKGSIVAAGFAAAARPAPLCRGGQPWSVVSGPASPCSPRRGRPNRPARTRGWSVHLGWLARERGVSLAGWAELRAWSVERLEDFWESIWHCFGVRAHAGYDQVLAERTMPGARWFTGATLNYAEHCFGTADQAESVAVLGYSQTRPPVEHVVHVPYGPFELDGAVAWASLLAPTDEPLEFEPVAFDHPLYVLFSSGRTGLPKAIVHCHGGILVEHLKCSACTGTCGRATGCCGSPRPRG
jgi:hypothetical protein